MQLDGLTLMVVGCAVAVIAGALLVANWAQTRSTPALLWWGASFFLNAAGSACFLAVMLASDPVAHSYGNKAAGAAGAGLAGVSMMLVWCGLRVFFGERLPLWPLAAAVILWPVSALAPVGDVPRALAGGGFIVGLVFLALACLTLARRREERLIARWPLVALFAFHAVLLIVGIVDLTVTGNHLSAEPAITSWFGLVNIERLGYIIGSALFMVVMTRERLELRSSTAAQIDSLTGVANRGAFFAWADRSWRRSRAGGTPIAVAVFDLDHFKAINDSCGHAAGDRVLRTFAECAMAALRPGDIFGRIGGEEFAAVLPGSGMDGAFVVAERIRHAFEAAPALASVLPRHPTVSAGIAVAVGNGSLDAMMEAADRALYRAKAGGRNRIERDAELRPPLPFPSALARTA